jgi:predicted RND superfamily exporter protein
VTGFALRYKWQVAAAWVTLLVAALAVLGARMLSRAPIVDNSVGIWFMKDDPDLKVYEDFNQQFGQKEWTILLLQAESVFDGNFLRDLARITERLERIEHVTKVISLTNVRDSEATSDGALDYRRLYPAETADGPLTPSQIEEFRSRLYANPVFENSILRRRDPGSTVLLIQNDNFINAPEPYRIEMVDAVRKVLDEYPRVRGYSLAGTSVVNAELNRASQHDGIRFYLLVTFFIVVATYAALRTWRDLVVVLTVVTAGALPPMAALAALGIPYNMVTIMLPTILITLSVCDVVHVINAFHFERRRLAPSPAIIKAIAGIWTPCMWTTVVTVVGFLSLAFSTVFPIWQLGVFAALGLGLAWLMTMTGVPILLVAMWPRGRTGDAEGADGAKPVGLYSRRLLPFQLGIWRWVWLVVGGVMVLSAYGIANLEVDTDYTKFFGKDMYVSRAYPRLAQAGYGQSPVALMLRFPAETTYAAGDRFARLVRFEALVRKDPAVLKLLTLTDLLERADLAFNGAEGAAGRLAAYDANQLGQLHLMAEIGGNDDLRNFVTDDKRTVQAVAMTPYMSSKELEALKERLYAAGRATLSQDVTLNVTGTTVQWANMDKEISHTQMSSLYIIGAVFLVLLPIIFRSWTLGVIGVIVNSLPMVITFGLMGLLHIKINLATALIGGVAIGATVDSTIFFINRVRLAVEAGMSEVDAVDHAVVTVGDGIIMTSVIVAGGFSCLATSSFLPTAHFGALVTLSIVVALFMDILVNPIVLRLVGARLAPASVRSSSSQALRKETT